MAAPLSLALIALLQTAGDAPPDIPALCGRLAEDGAESAADTYNLATCFLTGISVERDPARARALYEQAAGRGHGKAQCALGLLLMRGEGGDADPTRGRILCEAGAEGGDPDAQAELGRLYLTGEFGVERDLETARRWLLQAAEQGQGMAALLLGQSYWNRSDGGRDAAAAARWGTVAYEAGQPAAAFLVGRALLFELSEAGPPDQADPAKVDQAIVWFERASEVEPDPGQRQSAVRQLANLRDIREGL